MATLADLSDIINRLTGGNSGTPEHKWFWMDNRVGSGAAQAPVAGRYSSLWLYNGNPGGATAAPGAVAAPTNATDGALKQTNPGGGRQKWLLGASAIASSTGSLIVYDRLLHISGLSGTDTSDQTVGGTLTRYTGGAGNQIWIEIYTAIGTTATTISASYTDQDGNSGQTSKSVTIGGTGFREAQRIIPLVLADGDTGVQAVASVTLAASTLTAGDFGVTVAHPIAQIPIGIVGHGSLADTISGIAELPEIQTNACLVLAWLANNAITPQIFGSLHMIEK